MLRSGCARVSQLRHDLWRCLHTLLTGLIAVMQCSSRGLSVRAILIPVSPAELHPGSGNPTCGGASSWIGHSRDCNCSVKPSAPIQKVASRVPHTIVPKALSYIQSVSNFAWVSGDVSFQLRHDLWRCLHTLQSCSAQVACFTFMPWPSRECVMGMLHSSLRRSARCEMYLPFAVSAPPTQYVSQAAFQS